MSRLILFIRHGESESNRNFTNNETYDRIPDPSLSDDGKKQAEYTGQYLADRFRTMPDPKITVWYSPFLRTIETASPFLDKAKDIIIDQRCIPELQEYTRFLLPETVKDKTGCIEHDSYEHFISNLRVLKNIIWDKYQTMAENEHLVIFAHSLVISNLLMSFVGDMNMLYLQRCSIHIPNCSISCLRYNGKNICRIYTIASVAHLPTNLVTGTHVPFNSR